LTLFRAYDQAFEGHFCIGDAPMNIGRVFSFAVVAATLVSAPALVAQNQPNRRDQERRSQQEQRDTQALVQLVDAIVAGKQPAPTDIAIKWEANHFMRGADGTTYIPFSLTLDPSKLASPGVALYVRVISKGAAPAPAANDKDKKGPAYPWDNVQFLDVPPGGRVARAMALKAGEYDVLVTVREKSPLENQRNAPPLKAGFLRHTITVPDLAGPELSTSSLLIGSIEQLPAPLAAAQQQENPYTFGTMRVTPSLDAKLKKSGELEVLFWVYGTQANAGKPDLQIEYNFHQKTAEGEKYFNKTAPQVLNATTLPAQFDLAAGHQLPGSLVVPLASFPVGDYRLEIKLTDKLSGKTLTQNLNFTVEA
jgi:hypothetical protein